MKRAIAIILAMAALAATADTNTVAELEHIRYHMEQAREMYRDFLKEFRRLQHEYDEACLKAGITNSRPKAASSSATIFTKSQRRFFENRRYCVSRDTATIPGSVITTWFRGGKLDTKAPAVITNVLHAVQGAAQDNPLEALAERYRVAASDATRRLAKVTEDYMSVSNKAARLDALKTWLEERRDKAPLQTTKAIYQAIINRLEESE